MASAHIMSALAPIQSAQSNTLSVSSHRTAHDTLGNSSTNEHRNSASPSMSSAPSSTDHTAPSGDAHTKAADMIASGQLHDLLALPPTYYDPYTTLPVGYVPRASRWRRMLSKMHVLPLAHAGAAPRELPYESFYTYGMAAVPSGAPRRSMRLSSSAGCARLTVRNLEEFFDPASYSADMDVFRDASERENPYDNPRRRERVGRWIDDLP